MDCSVCAVKTGAFSLCVSCHHNRRAISDLSAQVPALARAMQKFAPDLMAELVKRHAAAGEALDDFVEVMRK